MVDRIDINEIKTGDWVEVDADSGAITVTPKTT
jgi:hypothetical protein